MLEAHQEMWFSNRFRLLLHGEVVGELRVSTLRARADLEIDGERYRFQRAGLVRGAFLMEREGRRLARAEKPSMFRSRFTVWLGGRSYQLQKVAVGKRSFVLLEDGTERGRLHRRGFFKRRMRLDLPVAWPLAAQAFIFWLALVVWTREDAAIAGS
jgi:hypothetical protein